jgi:hypothetical protein
MSIGLRSLTGREGYQSCASVPKTLELRNINGCAEALLQCGHAEKVIIQLTLFTRRSDSPLIVLLCED